MKKPIAASLAFLFILCTVSFLAACTPFIGAVVTPTPSAEATSATPLLPLSTSPAPPPYQPAATLADLSSRYTLDIFPAGTEPQESDAILCSLKEGRTGLSGDEVPQTIVLYGTSSASTGTANASYSCTFNYRDVGQLYDSGLLPDRDDNYILRILPKGMGSYDFPEDSAVICSWVRTKQISSGSITIPGIILVYGLNSGYTEFEYEVIYEGGAGQPTLLFPPG